MEHASLIDVFNAGTHAASLPVQQETAKLKELNDMELKNNAARFRTDIENYIRDNPYNGDYDKYFGKMQEYTDKWYGDASLKNTSPYFRKNFDVMRSQSLELARDHALKQEDAWRIKQEGVSFEADVKNYIDSGWEPEMALDAVFNRIELSKTRRQINPDEEDKLRRGAERAVYEKFATEAMSVQSDVNNLGFVMEEVNKRFGFMPKMQSPVYDEQGNETGMAEKPWGYEGKDDWEKGLIERETKRIQGEYGQRIQGAQGTFERAIVSGDINEAIRIGKDWGSYLNKFYNPENHEYGNLSDIQLNQFGNYFDIGKLKGYLEQDKGGGDAGKNALVLDYNLELFIRPQFFGDGTVIVGYNADGSPMTRRYDSLKEAMEGFIGFKRNAFFNSKGGKDAATLQQWQREEAKFFENFYDEVGKALGQINPTLQADFKKFRDADTYLTQGTKQKPNEYYNKDIGNLKNTPENMELRDNYAQRCIDFFHSIFFNGITDMPTVRQMMRDFTGQEITRFLQYKSTKNNEAEQLKQLKAFSDKAMSGGAEDILFVKHEPERLALGFSISGEAPEPTYVWRDDVQRQAVENVREDERKRAADILGLSLGDLKPYWMPSSMRKGDVIPKGMFVVGSGESAETYYLNYDDNANQVVMKQDPASGAWKEFKKVERPLTTGERTVQSKQTVVDYSEILRGGKNPLTGKNFDYKKDPPPLGPEATSRDMQIQKTGWGYLPPSMKLEQWANYFMKQSRDGND